MMPKEGLLRHEQLSLEARSRYLAAMKIHRLLVALPLLLLACERKVEPWDTLTLADLDGGQVRLGAHPSVFLFLETDCPVSNKYAPEIGRLVKEHAGLNFSVVYPGNSETVEALRAHRKSFGYPCPGLRDPDYRLTHAAQIHVTPEAAIFLPGKGLVYHGRIDDRFADTGVERAAPTTHDLEDALKAVDKGEAPPPASGRAVGCTVPE
jgi:hypothetical protein